MTTEPSGAVWSYWEDLPGTTRPPYLDLCLDTIRRHAPPLEVRCLGPEEALDVLPGIDARRWRSLPAPNYRSDYLRSRVLQRYGGIWMDPDTVALAPLSRLLDEIDGTGTVSFGRELGRFFGGLCAAVAGAAFVDDWVAEQDARLSGSADWSALGYAALAQDVTWAVARRAPWKALPMERVAPVPWYQWRRFLSRLESPRRILPEAPLTVVLWNAVMAPVLRETSTGDLLRSRTLLGRLLRIGLGTSTVTEEEDLWTAMHVLADVRFSRPGQGVELTARRLAGRVGGRRP
ncbi:MAG: hypothetical protein KGJ77_09270 [Acidobacteriota bacterium]|nr:hypothetical protein [Acidobacteriota bacterium]